jgi:hypothetical protein
MPTEIGSKEKHMKGLLSVLVLAAMLGGTVVAAGPTPTATTDPCAAEQAAFNQAKAAMRAYQPGRLAPTVPMSVAKADLQNKRSALNCCRTPTLAGCSK